MKTNTNITLDTTVKYQIKKMGYNLSNLVENMCRRIIAQTAEGNIDIQKAIEDRGNLLERIAELNNRVHELDNIIMAQENIKKHGDEQKRLEIEKMADTVERAGFMENIGQ